MSTSVSISMSMTPSPNQRRYVRLSSCITTIALFWATASLCACSSKKESKDKVKSAPATPTTTVTTTAEPGTGKPGEPTAGPGPAKGGDKPGAVAKKKPPAKKRGSAPPLPYRKALNKGRKLGNAGNYEQAAAVFREALKSVPDDPRALSELSWALFKAKKLDEAEGAARKSISKATGKLKAASLYNLGRVLEARDDSKGAAAAYRDSLMLRPHVGVGKRLAALTEEDGSPLAARTLDGPFADIEEICEHQESHMHSTAPAWECLPKEEDLALDDHPIYLDAKLLRLGGEEYDEPQGVIAVRLASGWFITEPFYQYIVPGMRHASGEVGSAGITTVAGEPVLEFIVTFEEHTRFDAEAGTLRFYCGAGVSGLLSCTPFIASDFRTWSFDMSDDVDEDANELESHNTYEIDLDEKTGKLTVKAGEGVSGERRGQVDTWTLAFP